jgi:hypothetical protein
MADKDDEFRPPQWTLEADSENRLARLSAALTDVLEHHPDSGPDIKGIFALMDGTSSGAAMLGYDDHITVDPVFDLIKQAGILFAAIGIKMTVVADNGTGEKAFEGPFQPEPPEGFTGEPVKLIIASEPGSAKMAVICRAVKESMQGSGEDWAGTQVVILVQPPGHEHSTMMYHGLEDGPDIAAVLMNALQRVISADGGTVMLVPMEVITGRRKR